MPKLCPGCGAELPTVATCDPLCPHCGGKGYITGTVERWCAPKPFKASHKQLTNYAHYRGHSIPKNSKHKKALDKENLLRMAKRYNDPLYNGIIRYREYEKMASTYGEGWMPGPDGAVHPVFGFGPATGQSNSSGPNCQNVPNVSKQGRLAEEFRGAIEARPGHVFVELDWKSFHAKTLGWEARDASYVRLAELDIHSYLAAFLLQLPGRWEALGWDNEKLGAWLKEIKSKHEAVRNKQAKRAILGWGFGMGAVKLYDLNRDSFSGVREAQGVFDALDGAFPVTSKFRREIPELAHRQKFLTTRFGAIRWFWAVKRWDLSEKRWVHGDDWEKAIAYKPAANAFGHKKAAMLRLAERGLHVKYGLCNDIHDALFFHCPVALKSECVENVREEMERASEVLVWPDGEKFSCKVDVKTGPTWADMSDWRDAA